VLTGGTAGSDPDAGGAQLLSLGSGETLGVVKFGNASITGSTGGWQAVGGDETTITFAAEDGEPEAPTITGAGDEPKLVGVGDATGAITIASDGSTETDLTVTSAEIDLTDGGSVVINFTDAASKLTLTKSTTVGKLTLDSAKATAMDSSNGHYAMIWSGSGGKGTVGGAGDITVTGSADETGAGAGSIAGNDEDATITGETEINAVTLNNAAQFADS
jgi:hypothetical protein